LSSYLDDSQPVFFTEYCYGDYIKEDEVGRTCGTHGKWRGVYRVLVGRPEDKRPLGRPRSRWEDKIRWTFGRKESMGRTGFSWLRIGSSGGLV
jgi:hypothetical protein